TTAAALLGRLATGFVIDRVSRRGAAAVTLGVQMAGVAFLAWAASSARADPGCGLFRLGGGSLAAVAGPILAVEWPPERFAPLVGLVVGINQFTFAFGPSLVGVLHDLAGVYALPLAACMAIQAVAAIVVLAGAARRTC